MTDLHQIFDHLNTKAEEHIGLLGEAVAIASISGSPDHRPELFRMANWLKARMEKAGADSVTLAPLGPQPGTEGQGTVGDKKMLELPPLVLAVFGNDPNKRTLALYGHYDVQPAQLEDGWSSDPFKMVVHEDGRMVGRGTTDDKGPLLGWIWVIEAYRALGKELPVNLRIIFEGMEESGSEGLEEWIAKEHNGFLKGVDTVCISDNYWLGKTKPCITHGLRGVSYFQIEVSGPGRDLHSGVYGGAVHEPMTALTQLMAGLVDTNGKILIDGVYDKVAPVTPEELANYKNIDFSMDDFRASFDGTCVVFDEKDLGLEEAKAKTLMARWRNPSLSLHGIEGAFYGVGAKTVIPAKVIGKFSIRTVPDMDIEHVNKCAIDFVHAKAKTLGTRCEVKASLVSSGPWWYANPEDYNFRAAARAIAHVHDGIKPDLTREGGSIPVTLWFQTALPEASVLLLPMGACDDNAHSTDEKLDKVNYLSGIKVMAAYLHEIAQKAE
ncbi:cytosolic nonspecific dipeptidase [Fonticula alba]|uniref:Cytosolic nonspecific dipeptidase n=1 Tax=Fonticula alba TaxID=691883 RepID=A0A058Z3Y7_FONAL|nr:cytosolic nonspecific dipeptidase [Fonticula alba]KCV68252.1 cytosolic nonspecific dipeptidase [Fonticula alba]|eukprot:XP_009497306.1 cytosolic nonspecific dipeptidase [Fonticula alba]